MWRLMKDKKVSLFVSLHKIVVKSWEVRVIMVTPLKGQDKALVSFQISTMRKKPFKRVHE